MLLEQDLMYRFSLFFTFVGHPSIYLLRYVVMASREDLLDFRPSSSRGCRPTYRPWTLRIVIFSLSSTPSLDTRTMRLPPSIAEHRQSPDLVEANIAVMVSCVVWVGKLACLALVGHQQYIARFDPYGWLNRENSLFKVVRF